MVDHDGVPEEAGRELDAAMTLLGAVRTQLGLPWADLSLGRERASATFVVDPPHVHAIWVRRVDLLAGYVQRLIDARAERIRARRSAADGVRAHAAAVRRWTASVDAHLAGEPRAAGAARDRAASER